MWKPIVATCVYNNFAPLHNVMKYSYALPTLVVYAIMISSWNILNISSRQRFPKVRACTENASSPVTPTTTWASWASSDERNWRVTYPDKWLGMGVGSVYVENSEGCPSIMPNTAWNGHLMWYELSKSLELCCSICKSRYPCVAFTYKPHDASMCLLYDSVTTSAPGEVGTLSGQFGHHVAPPDCRRMGAKPCDCPKHTWAAENMHDLVNRSAACTLLRGRVHFMGDSIIRDLWTTAALWLLVLDGFDPFFLSPGLYTHAACMANQWKYLENFGIIDILQARGLFKNDVFKVCGGDVELVYHFGRQFGDLPNTVQAVKGYREDVASVFVVGAGVLHMTEVGDNVEPVRQWALDLLRYAEQVSVAQRIVFMGMHHRVHELSPVQFAAEAAGSQGNAKIRLWNSIVSGVAQTSTKLIASDSYNITERMDASYRDTDDGMHMGFWVNLQKWQSMLMLLNRL